MDANAIFSAVEKFSEAVQKIGQIKKLSASISDLAPRCGRCYFWMMSSECPREKNINGYSRGPSCDGFPCEKFSEKQYVTELRDARKAQLAALVGPPS